MGGWWREDDDTADGGSVWAGFKDWVFRGGDRRINPMRHVLAGFLIAAVLMMFFVHTRGCDYAVHEFAAGAMPEADRALWDHDKPMDRVCGTNTKNDEGIQVCNEETRGK